MSDILAAASAGYPEFWQYRRDILPGQYEIRQKH